MSDVSAGADGGGRLLAPITVALLLGVGIASFVAMLVLGAYAPDMRGGGRRGGHALSDSFTGYSGLVRLAEATGRRPRIVRNVHLLGTEDLVVATPEAGIVPVGDVVGRRQSKPTLLVLPKWDTRADPGHRGWAYLQGLKARDDPQGVLAPSANLRVVQRRSGGRPLRTLESSMTGVDFAAPRPLQAIRPSTKATAFGMLEPLVVDERGNIVVGKFANRQLFILSDPDLLDNRGTHDARTAASALAMLDWMNSNQPEGIAFDVTLNGFSHGASPLKLVFEPPFLAMTLALGVAVLLAALGTVARFGSPRPRARAIAFGKTALVDNTALLVRKAGREARLGGRYVEVIGEAAARAFGVPARLRGEALDAHLDRLGDRLGDSPGDRPGRGQSFTALADAARRAGNGQEMTDAARALHGWMKGRNR